MENLEGGISLLFQGLTYLFKKEKDKIRERPDKVLEILSSSYLEEEKRTAERMKEQKKNMLVRFDETKIIPGASEEMNLYFREHREEIKKILGGLPG